MSLDELLKSRIIGRIKPNHRLAVNSIKRARRDIDTARTLMENSIIKIMIEPRGGFEPPIFRFLDLYEADALDLLCYRGSV